MERNTAKMTVSNDTFDDFLESESLLAMCEDDAIREIIADQIWDTETSSA